jgi:hypothetical protein
MLCLPSQAFLNTCDIDPANAVFRKAKRWGITECIYYVEDFIEIAQLKLFKRIICNNTHCLYRPRPNKRDCNYHRTIINYTPMVTMIFAHEDTSTNFQKIKPHSPKERTLLIACISIFNCITVFCLYVFAITFICRNCFITIVFLFLMFLLY